MDDSLSEATDQVSQARDALKDARVLLTNDGSDAGVLNRLYYAAFHAAQAVLYAKGETPSSHGHVRHQFGQRVVLAGDASREEGRLLGRLYDYRQEAITGGTRLRSNSTRSSPMSKRSSTTWAI